ncbi:ATP-binding protein [Frankia gtarii]|uniref:ATP-binding protein n=1 Tax=Frankia gtarii TaxID=2950102 RepID=UPI0021BFD426|nr:ATP-binding protein [Frankia gtarii]
MSAGPSPITRVAVEHYPAATATVPIARAAAVGHLRSWRVAPSVVETAELVVAELTANATKIRTAEGVIALRLTVVEGTLTVEVWDGSDATPVLMEPNADDESGRGLLLVDALSLRWFWYRPPAGGKVVWAQFRAEWRPTDRPGAVSPAEVLPTRSPQPRAEAPVQVPFVDDPALLQRVVDGLRALDGWHLPDDRVVSPPGVEGQAAGHAPGRVQ